MSGLVKEGLPYCESQSLGNGVHFTHIRADKFKTSIICLLLRQKLNRETATITALIPPVLRNGSKRYATSSALNAAVEHMYGAVFDIAVIKKGEEQIIQFYIEFVNGRNIEEDALGFMRELVLRPLVENGGFKTDYVRLEKQNLKSAIESRFNNKTAYAKLRCIEHMCEDEPFAIYADGYGDDLDGDYISSAALFGHYQALLKESPIEFIVLSNTDPALYRDKINTLFMEEITALGRSPKTALQASFGYVDRESRRISEAADIAQSKLCMGYRAGIDPLAGELCDLLVLNELLGGAPSSRLFRDIRERRNLCYYVNSTVFRFKSILLIQSGVDDSNIEEAIGLVGECADSLKNPDNITDDELSDAKKSLCARYSAILDNQGAIIEFNFAGRMLNDPSTIAEFISRINAAEKQAISKTARGLRLDTVYTLGTR